MCEYQHNTVLEVHVTYACSQLVVVLVEGFASVKEMKLEQREMVGKSRRRAYAILTNAVHINVRSEHASQPLVDGQHTSISRLSRGANTAVISSIAVLKTARQPRSAFVWLHLARHSDVAQLEPCWHDLKCSLNSPCPFPQRLTLGLDATAHSGWSKEASGAK